MVNTPNKQTPQYSKGEVFCHGTANSYANRIHGRLIIEEINYCRIFVLDSVQLHNRHTYLEPSKDHSGKSVEPTLMGFWMTLVFERISLKRTPFEPSCPSIQMYSAFCARATISKPLPCSPDTLYMVRKEWEYQYITCNINYTSDENTQNSALVCHTATTEGTRTDLNSHVRCLAYFNAQNLWIRI